MRRMKRRSNGKKHHAKKRRSNGHSRRKHAAPARRRRRRNDESAAPKKARKIRSREERIAAAQAQLERLQAGPKPKKSRPKKGRPAGYGAKTRAKRLGKLARTVEKDTSLFLTLDPELRREVAQVVVGRKKARAERAETSAARKAAKKRASRKKMTSRARLARITLRKGSKSSKTSKAIAKAWRSAMNAQKKAKSPAEQKLLRAMGLAGVPNPGMGGMFKDIGALLPQMGVSAVSLAVAAVAGQMVASKLVPADKQDSMLGKAAPSVISLGVGLAGYMALRKSKSMGKFAPWVLAGGVAAAAVHAIARITVKDAAGAPVTLGKRLGLPIGEYAAMAGYGEYAAMAGMGEYAAMAGGTAYSGERGIFSGLDDNDPVLSGTDDEDEVDMVETLADEGVNADEGSLNGSIFD